MSEQNKLNNIGMAKSKHQLDMEALQAGAMGGGSLTPRPYQGAASAPVDPIPAQAGETPEEAAVPDMQAANLAKAKTEPGLQDKLNAVAKARAKFYGEGI